jgi:hypothetical protein
VFQFGGGPVGPRDAELLVGGVQVLDPLQPGGGPTAELVGVGVPGPHEVPPYVGPAVEIHQPAGLAAGRGVDAVEIAGDDQLPRPLLAIDIADGGVFDELAGGLVDPDVAGQHGTRAGGGP